MACGTVALVVGMCLCSYIIERSTVEESWEIKKIGGGTVRVAWLQRGGVVGDELFNAYSLFPASPPPPPTWWTWLIEQPHRITLGENILWLLALSRAILSLVVLLGVTISTLLRRSIAQIPAIPFAWAMVSVFEPRG